MKTEKTKEVTAPICDFVRDYADGKTVRLHMPGHKGEPLLGFEQLDITEINGADSLFEANGIIKQSEETAGELFGANTLYSTEGSSLCIRAMVYLLVKYANIQGNKPLIWAGRNAHKTFLSAVALTDCAVEWLWGEEDDSYISCRISSEALEKKLASSWVLPTAVYITSPDYAGNISDVEGIARVCRKYGVLLAVDNAHGAYLKFLKDSRHPMDLGAHICCDSAHKTLPALTGCAYLHINKNAPAPLFEGAKEALAMFGSTSPSYLLLQSLDALNVYLRDGFGEKLEELSRSVSSLRDFIEQIGMKTSGDEPIKLTVLPKTYGYTGEELGDILRKEGFECEFTDPDIAVMMFTPSHTEDIFTRLKAVFKKIPKKAAISQKPPKILPQIAAMTPRMAVMLPSERVAAQQAIGRVLA